MTDKELKKTLDSIKQTVDIHNKIHGSSKPIDYHDFTTIDTPEEERRRLNVGDVYSNSAKCLECGDEIRSKNRHDFVTCSCGNLSVDGGSWYCKRLFKDKSKVEDTSIIYKDVRDEH